MGGLVGWIRNCCGWEGQTASRNVKVKPRVESSRTINKSTKPSSSGGPNWWSQAVRLPQRGLTSHAAGGSGAFGGGASIFAPATGGPGQNGWVGDEPVSVIMGPAAVAAGRSLGLGARGVGSRCQGGH